MICQYIPIGKVVGFFGIAGWVKIHSYTLPRENITEYSPWHLTSNKEICRSPTLESVRKQGSGMVAKFLGINDRTAAAAFLGCEITVEETQFKHLLQGEYYWFQLVDLTVVSLEGHILGGVKRLIETGANDVLVVEGEGRRYLIPYVNDIYIKEVDLEKMQIKVDWGVEWYT